MSKTRYGHLVSSTSWFCPLRVMRYKLLAGFKSINGQVEILDSDSLCYLVKNYSKGAVGVRTISKSLLNEYVNYFEKYPDNNADQARKDLGGHTSVDKFEYGYSSTLTTMAKMILGEQLSSADKLLSNEDAKSKSIDQPLQLIYYGAPGTGKSFTIDQVTNENNSVRTTFHPDSDYASFVGAYKPTMENVRMSKTFTSSKEGTYAEYVQKTDSHPGTEKKIVYKYVPQAFLKAYVEAWKRYSAGEDNPYYLVIEEINRGNCAQIFGDLFQLLDRNNMGCSSYAISADEDIAQFLRDDEKGFGKLTEEQINAIEGFKLKKDSGVEEEIGSDILNGSKLLLPPNLRIWATMNTSDQSLFPIDSAFKRRWNWEYMPIEYDPVDKHTKEPIRWKLEVCDKTYYWGQFLEFINPKILKLTLSEDKQMGYFFAKPDKKGDDGKLDTISQKVFVNKVLFYLWTDVFKDYDLTEEPFVYENDDKSKTPFRFTDFFSSKGEEMLAKFMDGLKLPLVSEETEDLVDEMEDGTIGSLGKFKVNGGKADTITWSVHQLLKPVVGNMSYEQLASKIKEFIPRQDKEVIKVIENPQAYTKENGWLKHCLTTADGISFVITNQWKKEYIPMVKALADNLGVEFEQI